LEKKRLCKLMPAAIGSLVLGAMALSLALGASTAVPQFRLKDTLGGLHTPEEWAGKKAVLLFFVISDCPVGNSYVPEMNRIRQDYESRGVAVYAVQADPTTSEAEVVRYAQEYRYTFPLLLDPRQTLVNFTGASVTPEAAILTPDGKLRYLGRIDNRVADFGKQRLQATELDVRDALNAVLAGKPVAQATTKAIGCAINRVK
jgi:peroxiredoxin